MRISLVAAWLAIVACSVDHPSGPVVVPVDRPAFDVAPNGAVFKGLKYATRHSAQRLDLYLPNTGAAPYPVVVWIHGGGWSTGDKALAPTAPQLQLLDHGVAVVSVNYRLSGTAVFPAQIHDVKAALRWLRARAATYQLDSSRLAVWGHSAGAHLAALAATSGGVASLTDLTLGNPTQPDTVSAAVLFASPVDFLTLDAQLTALGCPLPEGGGHDGLNSPPSKLMGAPIQTIPEQVATANPETYITPNDPPFLVQHGANDCNIPWTQSDHLRELLEAAGVAVDFTLWPTGTHAITSFWSPPGNVAAVIDWLVTHL